MSKAIRKGVRFSFVTFGVSVAALVVSFILVTALGVWHAREQTPRLAVDSLVKALRTYHKQTGRFPADFRELEARVWNHKKAPDYGADGRSLPEVIAGVREAIAVSAPAALLLLEERLAAVGFDASTDYSDRRWIIGGRQLYRVAEGFPRIIPAMHPPGLGEVRYAVSLPACQPWLVDPAALDDALRESFCHVGH